MKTRLAAFYVAHRLLDVYWTMFGVSSFSTGSLVAMNRYPLGRHNSVRITSSCHRRFGAFASHPIPGKFHFRNGQGSVKAHGFNANNVRNKLRTKRIPSSITSRCFNSNESNNDVDDFSKKTFTGNQDTSIRNNAIQVPDMTGWSVTKVVIASVDLLENAEIDEPEASVTNLLAHALRLPWESGFRELQHILDTPQKTCSIPTSFLPITSSSSTSMSPSSSSPSSLRQYELSQDEATRFQSFLQRRMHHEPIQYIVGQWDFMDSTFLIRAPLLCPRPETEELVLLIVDDVIRNHKQLLHQPELRILDVGCGTGVIGISLAKELLQRKYHHSVSVDAIDIEPIAVETSRLNSQRILQPYLSSTIPSTASTQPFSSPQARVQYCAHLVSAEDFSQLTGTIALSNCGYQLVVSNPPYIPPRDMKQLSPTVRLWESEHALCGGSSEDGMDTIRTILSRLPEWCCEDESDESPTKVMAVCWMEVDPSQPPLIQQMLERWNDRSIDGAAPNCYFQARYQVIWDKAVHDFTGKPRFVKIRVEPRTQWSQ